MNYNKKIKYVCRKEDFQKLRIREKNERGEIFSKIIKQADETFDDSKFEFINRFLFWGAGNSACWGDLEYLDETALNLLAYYYPEDIDNEMIQEIRERNAPN